LQTLPILNVSALSPKQLNSAVKLFDSMSSMELLPLHELDKDLVRAELDGNFAAKILGLDESVFGPGGSLELLRLKLAREPSVRGSKA
jgi:hypothetical protein